MNKLDEIFKEKLFDYRKEAPGSAWEKINARLQKPAWYEGRWKIAAAILLLCVSSALIWNRYSPLSVQEHLAENSNNPAPKKDVDSTTAINSTKKVEQQAEDKNVITDHVAAKIKEPARKKAKPHQVRVENANDHRASAEHNPHEQLTTPVGVPAIKDTLDQYIEENTEVNQVAQVTPSSSTIIFSKEEVNQKYLRKSSPIDATTNDENPSTLKKLLDKAYALKHNQDPVGELRQKKDEILALNFTKEKRSQNR